jgi:hypothetical protein
LRTIIWLHLKRFRRDCRGVSNIIVIALSLIIITIIVSNIILWNYQINQLDWEKMREDVKITSVSRTTVASWFVVQGEYLINKGSRSVGTYTNTQTDNGLYETFTEAPPAQTYALDINGTFAIDISTYPFAYISTLEVRLKYRASSTEDTWFLLAYNWTSRTYSNTGFNNTAGDPSPTTWKYYSINMTSKWQSYVRNDGTIYLKFCDEQALKGNNEPSPRSRTNVDIDFLSVRVVGDWTNFMFKNDGSSTVHIVSLWVIDSSNHKHYDADTIINSGETLSYLRVDVHLPSEQYTVKAVTEKGNVAVYSGS